VNKADNHITDIHQLLNAGMGLDLHWFPEDISLSHLATTLVGMANTIGGTVLLGIAPRSANIIGVRDSQMVIDRVFQAVFLAEPPLILPIPQVHEVDQATVVSIYVPPGLPHVYSLDGRYLGREGKQTNPISARRLRKLLIDRGLAQFETMILPDVGLNDLDESQVNAYVAALDLPRIDDPYEVLVKRGCLRKGGKKLLPNYAALLLFGRNPQELLPSATVLAARFTGKTISDHFIKQEFRGSLPNQLLQAEMFIREHVSSSVEVTAFTNQEQPEYPFGAVRELLVNAIAHRDYNHQGDCIHLNIFYDRLEVRSPGGLPGPVNLDNLLEARFSRNAIITQVLSDLGFVERLGYGLDRVVYLMHQQGLRTPKFEEIAGSFQVTLYKDPIMMMGPMDQQLYPDLEINYRQQKALKFLMLHKRITNSDFQELCPGVHPETLRRDLVDLVKQGALIKIGDKKATYYIFREM
jgi:ATP-dependent DNA helicase RecG